MTPDSSPDLVPTHGDFQRALERGANGWFAACRRITRNDALAEDAVQDALLSAWHQRRSFRGGARLETWIHRIAINSALSLLRRQRPWDDLAESDLSEIGEPDTAFSARADQEIGRDLELALTALSEMERVCFLLRHLEQWRLAEIARQLGTGTGPVKQALFRAVKKLRASPLRLRRQDDDR